MSDWLGQQWEYWTEHRVQSQEQLNGWGKHGWELISASITKTRNDHTEYYYVFKRAKEPIP